MGTDINWYVEVKHGDSWQFDHTIPSPMRCYAMFNLLAGVRHDDGDPEPRFTPQYTIPDDASDDVREASDDNYAYAHSYRTLAELQTHDWLHVGGGMPAILDAMSKLGSPDEVRAIFWFD